MAQSAEWMEQQWLPDGEKKVRAAGHGPAASSPPMALPRHLVMLPFGSRGQAVGRRWRSS